MNSSCARSQSNKTQLQSLIYYFSSFKYCCFEQADKKVNLNEAVSHNFSFRFSRWLSSSKNLCLKSSEINSSRTLKTNLMHTFSATRTSHWIKTSRSQTIQLTWALTKWSIKRQRMWKVNQLIQMWIEQSWIQSIRRLRYWKIMYLI